MSRCLKISLDLEDLIILVHAATRLTVQNSLDGAARLSRLQHGNGEWARSADAKRPITRVVLIGESAPKGTFLDTAKKWSRNGLSKGLPVQAGMTALVEMLDLEIATARGGAELAKRTLETLKDCVDNSFCNRWRRRVN